MAAASSKHLQGLRRRIEKLPPYPALLILAVPFAIVEPTKLAIVVLAGEGHWLTGAIGMICAYAVSLFLTHWLFGVVKPKLMTFSWFARGWRWFVAMRDKTWRKTWRMTWRKTWRLLHRVRGAVSFSPPD